MAEEEKTNPHGIQEEMAKVQEELAQMKLDKLKEEKAQLEEEAEAAEALEIEIVNPDMVTLDDGSVEVTIIPGGDTKKGGFNANIAEEMDEDELSKLADDIVDMVETDLSSRKEWADA